MTKARGAPVGGLLAAQDDIGVRLDAVLFQDSPGGMVRADVEDRRDLPALGAPAYQGRVTAPAQRKRKRIEKDGFACPGLAGQRAQAGFERNVEPVDDNDVTD